MSEGSCGVAQAAAGSAPPSTPRDALLEVYPRPWADTNKSPSEDTDAGGTRRGVENAQPGESLGCAWDVPTAQLRLNP